MGYVETGLVNEFLGFVKRISEKDNDWIIECEDALFVFNNSVADKEYKNISLSDLLADVCKQMNHSINVETDYEYTYDKFFFYQATGTKVLQSVQKDTGANIFFKNMTLYIRPPYPKYGDTGEVVNFDFTRNIQASNLTIKHADDTVLKIVVKYKNEENKEKSEEKGQDGGETKTFTGWSKDATENEKLAENLYDAHCYDGYEGDFTAWLYPYVEPEMSVKLTDPYSPDRTGTYYVTAVEVNFGIGGGTRKIKLGKKLG